jgi:propionyl-CoA carboxylase
MSFKSHIQTKSAEFTENYKHHTQLLDELNSKLDKASQGNPGHRKIHEERGKLFVRDRIQKLIDPQTPFLELSALAGSELYGEDIPAAGISNGDRTCFQPQRHDRGQRRYRQRRYVLSQLQSKNIFEPKKSPKKTICHVSIWWIQVVLFCRCKTDVFPDRDHFGRIFYNQAQMSQMAIPQISAVLGSCTAGGAYVPAMSDETVIVKNQGTIFLGGPPLGQSRNRRTNHQ